MNTIKKRLFETLIFLLPIYALAQKKVSFLQGVKNVVNDNLLPIFGYGLILAAAAGFVMNIEDIVDRDGKGTRSKGLINVAWIVGIVMASVLGIVALLQFIQDNAMTIE